MIDQRKGKIELILGPMFAGKSSELLNCVKRHQIAGHTVLLVKHAADTRYQQKANALQSSNDSNSSKGVGCQFDLNSNSSSTNSGMNVTNSSSSSCSSVKISSQIEQAVITHDQTQMRATLATDNLTRDLLHFPKLESHYDIVAIDEGQFFNDIVQVAEILASAPLSKKVIVAGLSGTFERKPFGNFLELVPKAEKITQLKAICVVCKQGASFTERLMLNNPNQQGQNQIQIIGGMDLYQPVCRECFIRSSIVKKTQKESLYQLQVQSK